MPLALGAFCAALGRPLEASLVSVLATGEGPSAHTYGLRRSISLRWSPPLSARDPHLFLRRQEHLCARTSVRRRPTAPAKSVVGRARATDAPRLSDDSMSVSWVLASRNLVVCGTASPQKLRTSGPKEALEWHGEFGLVAPCPAFVEIQGLRPQFVLCLCVLFVLLLCDL